MRLSLSVVAVAVAATAAPHFVGCSSQPSSPTNPDAGTTTTRTPTNSFTLSFPTITIPPSTERTQCVVKRLGNPDKLHAGIIHNVLGAGSHHMIVYRVSDTTEQPTPFDCRPFTDSLDPSKGVPLMITQRKDDVLTLPPGVAFTLDANQMIRLEVHYINPNSSPVDLTATSTFTPISDQDFKDEAGFLFMGNLDVSLPPNAMTTLGPTFMALDPKYANVSFFAFTGHEHQYGTDVTISIAKDKTDTGTSVYDVPNWLWNEPQTVYPSAPVQVPAGGGFRFTCTWNNTSPSTVNFSESATGEMCFFWAYYYPDQGAQVCFHSDRVLGNQTFDACCPGNPACSFLK
jgi:hypothetical protein